MDAFHVGLSGDNAENNGINDSYSNYSLQLLSTTAVQ